MSEEMKTLATAVEEMTGNVVKAQERQDVLEAKGDARSAALDTELKSLKEAALASADAAEEVKAKLAASEKTVAEVEKQLARFSEKSDGAQFDEAKQAASEAIIGYIKNPSQGFSEEAKSMMADLAVKSEFAHLSDAGKEEVRKTLIAGSNADGGFFISPEKSTTRIQRIFESSPMRQIASQTTIASDQLDFIIDDNESSTGGWVGELEARDDTATPKVGELSIVTHEQYAMPVATQKMLNTAGFDIEGWVNGKTQAKMIRTENTAFVSGDGSKKPMGILSYPAWAVEGAYERGKVEQFNSGENGLPTADALKKFQNLLVEDYQSNATWLMNRSTWSDIITLKDSDNRYLLNVLELSGLSNRDGLMLLGRPVRFASDMPVGATGSLSIAYGDFAEGYNIVDQAGFRLIRDNVTTKGKVKYYVTKYTGGDVTSYQSFKLMKFSA
jgi:HK97 family phage major capsid protein|tara:strand:+ start:2400 stop:3728 length:1329 start_codon:yes stop_codon:yes gene_type:complete